MSTRETHSRGLGAAVVIAALGGAGASAPALGVPVAFENPAGPGHFVWNASAGHEYLNITLPAASQPGVAGGLGTFVRSNPTSPIVGFTISGTTSASRTQIVVRNVTTTNNATYSVGVAAGTIIPTPTGPDLGGFGTVAYFFVNSDPGFTQTEIPEGVPTYLGTRINLGAGNQFGWIGVIRTGQEVDAFAWGYETQVGVPIAAGAGLVPAPGCGALVMGAAILAGRRRKRD